MDNDFEKVLEDACKEYVEKEFKESKESKDIKKEGA